MVEDITVTGVGYEEDNKYNSYTVSYPVIRSIAHSNKLPQYGNGCMRTFIAVGDRRLLLLDTGRLYATKNTVLLCEVYSRGEGDLPSWHLASRPTLPYQRMTLTHAGTLTTYLPATHNTYFSYEPFHRTSQLPWTGTLLIICYFSSQV